MKFITFSLILTTFLLVSITSVYAEFLNTDILKKFFPITGAATEAGTTETTTTITTTTETTPAPTTPAAETTTTETTTTPPTETTTTETTTPPPTETTTTETTTPPPTEEKPITKPLPPVEIICPAVMPEKPECPEGEFPREKFSDKGCLIAYECAPMIKPPEEVPITCPQTQTCSDDSTVFCRIEDSKCICDPCPIKEEKIPEGCRQEVNKETGTINIVCEEIKCPEMSKERFDECTKHGGNPTTKTNPNGCQYIDCVFGRETNPNPIGGYQSCPSREESEEQKRKCTSSGLGHAFSFEGGCKIVKCVDKEEERCKVITAEMRLRIEEGCEGRGLKTIKDFDENGCPYFACAGEEFCKRDLPKEAFDECRMGGGEMVIKRGEKGCIVYSNCVERGDERDVYVEPVEKVPEPTELLSVAFKLEQLKIELDKLSRQADDIADYYASVGDPEEHRFRRASSMFAGIKDKIDEIKNNLRNKLETLTPEDIEQINFDVKSVKGSLKDIVYVMLSNSDDVKEMIQVEAERKKPTRAVTPTPARGPAEGANCGTDGMCFDRAIRVCKPVTFLPEGRAGPTVTITGLEGDACVLHIELPEGAERPPGFVGKIYMDCPIKEYSFGVRGPEDILPYCKGPMKELMEKYGPPPGKSIGQPQEFGGPGGCKSDIECREYCDKNLQTCLQWCRDHPETCPSEAEFDLKQSVEGTRGFEFCTDEAKRLFDDCADRGGRPQSDPSPEGKCEVYTSCLMPETTGKCDCSWPAGSKEHPTGCPVLCSDYSYDASACEAQTRNGCVWVGGVAPAEKEELAVQPCVGCLNNGMCDVGECSECADCLRKR